MTIEEIYKLNSYELFGKLLENLKVGMEFIFTPKNVFPGDDFLIFSAYDEIKMTYKRTNWGIAWLEFDCDEPMLLENTPDSFRRTILLNIK